MSLRLAFLGSPEPAAVALRALAGAGHDIAVAVTRPDKRRGRGGATSPTPVKAAALELGIPVSHDIADVTTVEAELGVVVAYGRIIKPDVLARLRMLNIHFSLLPRWRGAAPVERAILAGDAVTGVCLMDVEEGLDAGAVYRRLELPIGPSETAAELTARLAEAGAGLLVEALSEGLGRPVPQAGEATYAAKIEAGDLHLEWSRSAAELHRVVRVGRAWTTWRGQRLLVLGAEPVALGAGGAAGAGSAGTAGSAPGVGTLVGDVVVTGSGGLRLLTVQPEGRRALVGAEWVRGARPAPGERLGA